MKVKKSSIILLLIVSAVFISCSDEAHVSKGKINLFFSEDEIVKTLTPVDGNESLLNICDYDYVLKTPSGHYLKGENLSNSVSLNDMVVGTYNIVVYGKNSAGTVLAEGDKTFKVKRGDNNIAIELNALTGTGSLAVSFVWDPDRAGEVSYIAKLKNMKTGVEYELIDDGYNYLDGMCAFSKLDLPSGSYILTLELLAEDIVIAGYVEAVRIGPNLETTTEENYIEIPIGSEVQIMNITVKDMTGVPIVGSISANATSMWANGMPENLELSYSISTWNGTEGIEDANISVNWYANSVEIGSGNNISYAPDKDQITITAVFYQDEYEGSIGSISKTLEYDVLPSGSGFSEYTP